jgi:hypothetical protein
MWRFLHNPRVEPAALMEPVVEAVRALADRGELAPARRDEIRANLGRLRDRAARHAEPKSDGERELLRIARWALDRRGRADDPLGPR